MMASRFFHLDCTPIIPECGYQCDKCIQEIYAALKGLSGVSEVTTGKLGEISGIVVRYDSEAISIEAMMDAFRSLPTFYSGFFIPKVLEV